MKTSLSDTFYFEKEADVLTLHKVDAKDSGLRLDFLAEIAEFQRQKISPKQDLLAKAISVQPGLKVADLTLGLAQDALKLCYFGAQVTGIEAHPWIFALVENAVERASSSAVVQRLSPQLGSSYQLIDAVLHSHDVFYLDPMYSHKRKALPKKEMQYLAEIAQPADDGALVVLMKRIAEEKKRLVVKRAPKAPFLGDMKPRRQVEGKLVRFDIYG